MAVSPDTFSIQWDQFGAAIAAVGSLGVAAFGIVESLGKALAFTISVGPHRRLLHWGLPYVGLGAVKRMVQELHPALRVAYGNDFAEIIAQQYRSGRSDGTAPDTIRQGVRLGLPFLGTTAAATLISSVWHLDNAHAVALAEALQATNEAPPAGADTPTGPTTSGTIDPVQALAGRFATALDARISAGFQLADERYETVAKTAAGVGAIALALGFNWGLGCHGGGPVAAGHSCGPWDGLYAWPIALGIGIVAVPLAPVAKDLSTAMQNALTAFKSISGKSS